MSSNQVPFCSFSSSFSLHFLQFIIQAVEVVTQAIDADKEGDYEKALQLYRKSLDYFMTGFVALS
jgi:hypothetical protein